MRKIVTISDEVYNWFVSRGTPGASFDAILRANVGLMPKRKGPVPKPRPEKPVKSVAIDKYYDVKQLIPNIECIIPWVMDDLGQPVVGANGHQNRAALRIARERGWTVRTEGTPRGLRVTRLS